MSDHYTRIVFWSEEDNCFVAIVPDLAGLSAFGNTPEEAIKQCEDAIIAWKETCIFIGNVVPYAKSFKELEINYKNAERASVVIAPV